MAVGVGAVVRHRKAADWGLGRVVESHADGKVKVHFQRRQEPVVIAAAMVHTMLEVVENEPWSLIAIPAPAASGTGLKCTNCSRILRRSIKSKDGRWKSCPNCSGNQGSEHVFRRMPEDFGESEARAVSGVEGGDQSWCYACRSGASTVNGARLCHEFAL